jgi:hypothetical protein
MKKYYAPDVIKFILDKNKSYTISKRLVFVVSVVVSLSQIPLFAVSFGLFPNAFKNNTAMKQGLFLIFGYYLYFRKLCSYLSIILRRTACLNDAVKLLP